ncbi:MAG: DUF3558 family protein [Corynebacteriales bacterium]|nr:DUF3558 family protein [Mycobacteriales bacterium]
MRRVAFAAAILACTVGLAACNDNDGNDVSGAKKGGTSMEEKSKKTGTPLAGTDPCALLKPADVPELTQDSTFKPKANGNICSGYDFAITIDDVTESGYDMAFDGSDVTALPDIAGHKAAISESNVGGLKSCHVVLEVTSDELVDVTVTHGEEPSRTCEIAKKAAVVVANRIPD